MWTGTTFPVACAQLPAWSPGVWAWGTGKCVAAGPGLIVVPHPHTAVQAKLSTGGLPPHPVEASRGGSTLPSVGVGRVGCHPIRPQLSCFPVGISCVWGGEAGARALSLAPVLPGLGQGARHQLACSAQAGCDVCAPGNARHRGMHAHTAASPRHAHPCGGRPLPVCAPAAGVLSPGVSFGEWCGANRWCVPPPQGDCGARISSAANYRARLGGRGAQHDCS